jgi:3-oxoacyl-[acyl-carrier protein] reductase
MSGEQWGLVVRTVDCSYNVLQPLIMPMIGAMRQARGDAHLGSSLMGVAVRPTVPPRARSLQPQGAGGQLAAQLTVNCVAPGLIATDMTEAVIPLERILKTVPMQRVGRPRKWRAS